MAAKPRLINGHGSPQSIFDTSKTRHHDLGTRGVLDDGRVFYYASHVGAGIAIGSLCTIAARVANHISVAYASGGAAGSNKVTVTLGATAATANQYRFGDVFVHDGTGSGQRRRIREHPAAGSAATLELTLFDPIETSLAAGAELTLVKNLYDSIIITPGDSAAITLVGVPQLVVPAGSTDPQYFWVQTYGPGLVIGDGSAFTDGGIAVAVTGVAADDGQITLGVDGTNYHPYVGDIIEAADGTSDLDHRYVDLKIRA